MVSFKEMEAGVYREEGIMVVRRHKETFEEMMRRFKKKYSKSGILQDLKKVMFFEKDSVRKRRKRSVSEKRRKKELEKIYESKERKESK